MEHHQKRAEGNDGAGINQHLFKYPVALLGMGPAPGKWQHREAGPPATRYSPHRYHFCLLNRKTCKDGIDPIYAILIKCRQLVTNEKSAR